LAACDVYFFMHSKLSLVRKSLAVALFATAVLGASAEITPLSPALHDFVREEQARTMLVQMQTYRWDLDALARNLPPEDKRYTTAYELVQRGEMLIHRLRSAHPAELIVIRTEYEKNREQLDRSLGRTRGGY